MSPSRCSTSTSPPSESSTWRCSHEEGARLLNAIAKATASAATPRAQVEQGFAAYFQWVADDREAFLLLFGSGARRDEEFAEEVRRVEDAIALSIAPLIQADIDADHQHVAGLRPRRSRRGHEPPPGADRHAVRPRPARPPGRRPGLVRAAGRPPGVANRHRGAAMVLISEPSRRRSGVRSRAGASASVRAAARTHPARAGGSPCLGRRSRPALLPAAAWTRSPPEPAPASTSAGT